MYLVGYSFSNPIYMFYHITKDFSVGIFYKPKQKYIIIQHRMFFDTTHIPQMHTDPPVHLCPAFPIYSWMAKYILHFSPILFKCIFCAIENA